VEYASEHGEGMAYRTLSTSQHDECPFKDCNFPGASHISNEELLTLNTDVLIPAALENQINEKIAPDIKASIIIEGANGPTTLEADKILEGKKKVIVPDILANAGGVIVSYFEWVQNAPPPVCRTQR
jgi:glutamate dehydrogenase/leucine dehydrogenase